MYLKTELANTDGRRIALAVRSMDSESSKSVSISPGSNPGCAWINFQGGDKAPSCPAAFTFALHAHTFADIALLVPALLFTL